jgi:general secretion pathway protein L
MAKLILFWGEKYNQSFTWRLSTSQGNGSPQTAAHLLDNYQLESKQILKADLACIADMAESNSVTLVLSSIDIVTAHVEVPNKAQRLLRKVVPYMLEDEIATSVDDLFFAFAERNKLNHLPVRGVERIYLESLQEQFKLAEILLSEIVVDMDLLSPPEEGIKLLVTESQCLTVDDKNVRWHCHPDDFVWLIQKQISSDDLEDELPVAIPMDIYSEELTDEFVHELPVGRFAPQHHQVSDICEFMLEQEHKGINLLQAEYEPKKENSKLTDFLLKVASIAGFVLLTHLIYQGSNIYTLSEKKQQLDAQKITLYKQAFPGIKTIRSPEKSMRTYIKSLGSSSGGGDFLSLLTSSSELLTDLSKIYPTNINYDNTRSELRIDMIASDLMILDKYAEALKANGHQVEKSSETKRSDGYSSRLIIRK